MLPVFLDDSGYTSDALSESIASTSFPEGFKAESRVVWGLDLAMVVYIRLTHNGIAHDQGLVVGVIRDCHTKMAVD